MIFQNNSGNTCEKQKIHLKDIGYLMCVYLTILLKSLGCPQCHSTNTLYVEEIDSKRKGLASCLLVKCSKCTYAMQKYTSQVVENVTSKRGMKNYEVNMRSIYAMRSCGVGHTGMNLFCGLMNMPHL